MKLSDFVLTEVSMDFDATSLYPSAMWFEKSKFCEVETGFAFTVDMNDGVNEKFNTQIFTQYSAILKLFILNPEDLLFQQLPLREKFKKT